MFKISGNLGNALYCIINSQNSGFTLILQKHFMPAGPEYPKTKAPHDTIFTSHFCPEIFVSGPNKLSHIYLKGR